MKVVFGSPFLANSDPRAYSILDAVRKVLNPPMSHVDEDTYRDERLDRIDMVLGALTEQLIERGQIDPQRLFERFGGFIVSDPPQ